MAREKSQKKTTSARQQATASPRKSPQRPAVSPTCSHSTEERNNNAADEPSASSLLQHSQLTTDEWYKAKQTRKAYANYVKAGKVWLAKWVTSGQTEIEEEGLPGSESPTKGCQGEYWRQNKQTGKWEGIPVFQIEYKSYFELLKNRDGRTGTSTQALAMLPKDLKVILNWIKGPDGAKKLNETRRLYINAFMTTAFCLWTR
ncbi:hypothetical protein B0H21DRAFT_866119 [Amylocystis lapponica]|nr:hypothetical protein B0H21DRAFT_866119 [Amylocystis lapponica]